MLLSAIEQRKRGYSVLFMEDGTTFRILTEIVLTEHLAPGQELSEEVLEELLAMSRRKRAGEKALTLLDYRAYSKKELMDRLARESGREAAEEAADRMEELGLLNDEDFARRYAEELFHRKGFSKDRVRQELFRRGIERDLAEEITEELAPSAEGALRDLIERKYIRYLEDEKGRRRVVAALQRLGYRYEDIRRVLREYSEYTEDRDEGEWQYPLD